MNLKTVGAGVIITGVALLVSYPLYMLFTASDVPLYIKVGIGLVVAGILIAVPTMFKEAKKDKVKIK